MTKTYRIETRDGRTITRRSEADYVAASVVGDRVRFHTSREAARRAAGTAGYVVAVEGAATGPRVAPPTSAEIAKAEARAAVRRIRREHGIRSDEYRAAEADYFRRFGRP